MKVKKRNGKIVDFDLNKIILAVEKAFIATGFSSNDDSFNIVINNILEQCIYDKKDIITVEEIQDIVEKELVKGVVNLGINFEIPKRYILYRDRRNKDRESINKLATTFHDVINIEDNNIKKSNANIDGNTPAGQMMIFGAESSKEHASNFIINPKFIKAHKDGFIHIHDLDYYSTKACNCNQIDLVDLFSHDYIYTNDSVMRRPKRIASFAALAAIALQSEQNEMFGGQSIHSWDYAMAKGVALSFIENFKEFKDVLDKANNPLLKTIVPDEQIKIGNEDLEESMPELYRLALEKTIKDTHEAMAAFIYNINSMHSRGGGQVVFSSLNYGTDDSPEGRIVIEQTLNAVNEGLGDGSTAIFPISVFRVKEGVNFSEEDWELAKNNWKDAVAGKLKFKTPNFDLFIKACVVSSRRLFPNFVFEDTPFNYNPLWHEDDPNRYKYEISSMGCRTRVYDDIFGEKTNARRGNLTFTTVNLPRLAIESRLECIDELKEFTEEDVIKIFYSKLDYYMNLVHDQLVERYRWQCSAYGCQFPFIIKNHMIIGTENVKPNNKMSDALKHGTLGVGFIGLAETLKELIGFHHGESDKAQKLGLEIIGHMREATDKMTKEDNLNFGLFATPEQMRAA